MSLDARQNEEVGLGLPKYNRALKFWTWNI